MHRGPSLTVPAPAKLNLFLHVTGRRDDGYHTLESVMVLLDFGDEITVTARDDGRIEAMHSIPGVASIDDLTTRAAQILQRHSGVRAGATIALDKRIPIGAGMGGGSSDAASVLLALNRLWNTGLTRPDAVNSAAIGRAASIAGSIAIPAGVAAERSCAQPPIIIVSAALATNASVVETRVDVRCGSMRIASASVAASAMCCRSETTA